MHAPYPTTFHEIHTQVCHPMDLYGSSSQCHPTSRKLTTFCFPFVLKFLHVIYQKLNVITHTQRRMLWEVAYPHTLRDLIM